MSKKFLVLHGRRAGGMVLSDALHAMDLMNPIETSAYNLGYGPGLKPVYAERHQALLDTPAQGWRLGYLYARHLEEYVGAEALARGLKDFPMAILIKREDKVRQAITAWMARMTGIHISQDWEVKVMVTPFESLPDLFDPAEVQGWVGELEFEESYLRSIYPFTPLEITFERFTQAPATTIRDILKYLEVPAPTKIPTERTLSPVDWPIIDTLTEMYSNWVEENPQTPAEPKENRDA